MLLKLCQLNNNNQLDMDHMTLKAMYKDILRMHLKHRRIQLHSQVSRLLDLN